ncbi:MAG: PhzF family phenazine biosynthesis protein [Candidatus Aminicenantes bacterium]|nr:PhzF family phenazine biosynthesis protein [Candidatus Aminicenantes bacterium]
MKKRRFYILDVFAEKKYAGNQLGVFRDAADLTSDEMQAIAREMNYSETTFILSEEQQSGGYEVRIFTPAEEVPFAGHPTLGTAFLIQQKIIGRPVEKVILNLKAGPIPVSFVYANDSLEYLWMKQNPPEFGRTFDQEIIAKALTLEKQDLLDKYPVQEVSTGLPFLIAPLRDLSAVKKARINKEIFFDLIKTSQAKSILVFAPETYDPENDLNVRVFVDYYGIPEDPATGSANGCLAAYLIKNNYFDMKRIDIRVEQGYEIGRESLLLLRSESNNDVIEVNVGGRVMLTAEGFFY